MKSTKTQQQISSLTPSNYHSYRRKTQQKIPPSPHPPPPPPFPACGSARPDGPVKELCRRLSSLTSVPSFNIFVTLYNKTAKPTPTCTSLVTRGKPGWTCMAGCGTPLCGTSPSPATATSQSNGKTYGDQVWGHPAPCSPQPTSHQAPRLPDPPTT